MKPIEEMTRPEMENAVLQMFGLTAQEAKDQFPTDDKLREFIIDSKKGRGVVTAMAAEEDKLGWASVDKTSLDDEGNKVVSRLRKKSKQALTKSIAKAGGQVTPAEVNATMRDVNRLLSSDDDEN